MIALRSSLFTVLFYSWTMVLAPSWFVLKFMPQSSFWALVHFWIDTSLVLFEKVAGIRYEVRGADRLPPGPFVIASKHQSAWDTFIFNKLFDRCAYVLKRELFRLPFYGWFLQRAGMVGIDRSGGAQALKGLVRQVRDRLAEGRTIVIFPQGTRTPPGAERAYLPGVSALYMQAGVPVVPVALNSGMFWPRRRFRKWPGTIVLEFLPAIAPGLDRRSFERALRESIEPATRRLEAEAAARYGFALPAARDMREA